MSLIIAFLLFTLLNAFMWLVHVPNRFSYVSFAHHAYLFALAELGPIAMILKSGFSLPWSIVLTTGIPAVIAAAIRWPHRLALVVLAHLCIPIWFLHGCAVAGLGVT